MLDEAFDKIKVPPPLIYLIVYRRNQKDNRGGGEFDISSARSRLWVRVQDKVASPDFPNCASKKKVVKSHVNRC